MFRKYNIGVIGAGARAETFARQLHEETPRAKLFGVCDIDEDRLAKFCDYCGLDGARRFTDPAKFIAADEMDAVIVTVPEFVHADITCAALAAGKHVYLEKPLAATMEDCYRIDQASRQSKQALYIGFNLRASQAFGKIRQLVQDGAVGEVYHISGLEQVGYDHGASFMRRWHRRTARSGGFLNTKCCHDLDIIQWIIGHEHKVARVASFGGLNFFNAQHAPKGHGSHCHNCPSAIRNHCPYIDHAGFFFPVYGKEPIYKTAEADVYGNDLCVYNDDKDIIDNQTIIMEWDHGVRGDFNLKPFQGYGHRETRVWGEKGMLALTHESRHKSVLRLTSTATRDETEFYFAPREGGHGGTDPSMLGRFMDTFEGDGPNESNISHGLAATLLALKADESRKTGKVVEIKPTEYGCLP